MSQVLQINHFPRPDTARALSPNGRMHWAARKRHRDHAHRMVMLSARMQQLKPMHGFVIIQPTFIFPEQRARDDDNLATGVMKAVRDALVRGGFIEADDMAHLRQLPVQARVEKGNRALLLEFEVA